MIEKAPKRAVIC